MIKSALHYALWPIMALTLGLAIMFGNPDRLEPTLVWWEGLRG